MAKAFSKREAAGWDIAVPRAALKSHDEVMTSLRQPIGGFAAPQAVQAGSLLTGKV
jgi:hypothetical protein